MLPLTRLRATQHDVVSRAQLDRRTTPHDHVARQILAGRWQALGPRVVVLHNGPLTPEQLRWAAVLNSGGALAGPTAAAGWGLEGYDDAAVHVVVPRGAKVPPLDGVVVHESRRFDPARDTHPTRRPPRVRLERAIVDAAAWSPNARRACAILAAAVQQRLTTATRLRAEQDIAGHVRHCRITHAVLGDIEGGAQALSEIDFVALCRRHRLPEPTLQVIRLDGHGRRRYLDAEFDGFSVEVDGAIHLRPFDARADAQRQNALVLVGAALLRFPSVVVRLDEAAVVADLRRAFARFSREVA